MGPGSGAGATVEAAPPSVPVNDRWYNFKNGILVHAVDAEIGDIG